MAEFLIAYKITNGAEGGYANDPDDAGGETWGGIARKRWPGWRGWALIDALKRLPNFPAILDKNNELHDYKEAFYLAYFWTPIKGKYIDNQITANIIYDSCVNISVEQGIKMAQRSARVPQTGKMDQKTLNAINNK